MPGAAAGPRFKLPVGFDTQGHRGARGLMPEDTIPAMLEALRLGVTTLELDVVISRDQQVVVSHDAYMNSIFTLDPQGNTFTTAEEANYLLYQMDYATIRQFDVGMKGNPSFPGQQKMAVAKPLLAELIDAAEAYAAEHNLAPVRYNIETKSTEGYDGLWQPAPAEFVERVMGVLLEKGISSRVTIQSFDRRTLQALRAAHPTVPTSLLVSNSNAATLEENLAALGFTPTIYSPDYRLVNADLVAKCQARGMQVLPWTVNSLEVMSQMIALGVDGIISDYPNLFAKLAASPDLLSFYTFNEAQSSYADDGLLQSAASGGGAHQQAGAAGSGVSGRQHDRAWDASANTTRGAGVPANDSRVTAASNFGTLNGFTLVFWYKLDQPLDDAMRFVFQANALSNPTRGFFVRALNNRLQIFLGNGASSTGISSTSFSAGSGYHRTGDWVFVAITWDGATVTFYQADAAGNVTTAGSGTFAGPWAAAESLLVLGNASSFNRGVDGLLDNVRIFNGALVASELAVVAREDLQGLRPTFASWRAFQGFAGTGDDENANGMPDLLDYALATGTDPVATTPVALTSEQNPALTLSFDFVYTATDLEYTVESSGNLQSWTPVLTLDPWTQPYRAHGDGPRSLAGAGGVASLPVVVALENAGYTARITVRDTDSFATARFLRLRVTAHEASLE